MCQALVAFKLTDAFASKYYRSILLNQHSRGLCAIDAAHKATAVNASTKMLAVLFSFSVFNDA